PGRSLSLMARSVAAPSFQQYPAYSYLFGAFSGSFFQIRRIQRRIDFFRNQRSLGLLYQGSSCHRFVPTSATRYELLEAALDRAPSAAHSKGGSSGCSRLRRSFTRRRISSASWLRRRWRESFLRRLCARVPTVTEARWIRYKPRESSGLQ